MKVLKTFFVVTVFLLTLVAVIYDNISSHCGIPKVKIARLILAKTEISIKEYYIDTGHLPASLNLLLDDPQSKNWMGPYIKEKGLTDPWGEKYHYQIHNNKTFTLGTFAEDKKPDGEKLATDISITSSIKADE